jgi:hypothetical protein
MKLVTSEFSAENAWYCIEDVHSDFTFCLYLIAVTNIGSTGRGRLVQTNSCHAVSEDLPAFQ